MRWFGKGKKREQQQLAGEAFPGDVVTPADRLDPQPAAKDRVVRVFVSSTFRDMVEDRNELMSHVWPALRKLCRDRAVELTADGTGTCSVSPNDTIVYHSGPA